MDTAVTSLCFVLLTLYLTTDTVAQPRGFRGPESTTTDIPATTNSPATSNTVAVYTRCGGRLVGNDGTILSPEYPNNYPRNCRCTWEIVTSPGTYVVLYFASFKLESHPTCFWDFVSIHNGPPGSEMIGKICNAGNPTFYASSNLMTIVFKSDTFVEYSGFMAVYYTQTFYSGVSYLPGSTTTTVPPLPTSTATTATTSDPAVYTRCGGRLVGDIGAISSPEYPNNYPPNCRCTWEIVTSPDTYVVLYFTSFNIEPHPKCYWDFVSIHNGPPGSEMIGKICNPGNYTFYASSNLMTVVFTSNQAVEFKGFMAGYYTVTSMPSSTTTTVHDSRRCGGYLIRGWGSITSPYYPSSYAPNTMCTWEIVVTYSATVQINIHIESLENNQDCTFDYVEIHDGYMGTSLGKICYPGNYYFFSSMNRMTVVFRSNGNIEGRGFEAQYYTYNGVPFNNNTSTTSSPTTATTATTSSGQSASCGGNLNSNSGSVEITSPFYPQYYPPNSWCVWQITAPPGLVVRVMFHSLNLEFHETCVYDYIKIYDGNSQFANLCTNQTIGHEYEGETNTMRIEFRSDGSVESTGFRATYKFVEGLVINEH